VADACRAQVKSFLKERAEGKLKKLDELFLRDMQYLAGDKLTVADIYCYIVLTWLPHLGLGPLDKYPAASAFFERVKANPKVQEAHKRMDSNPAKVLG
jgi:glutathione S-transferase